MIISLNAICPQNENCREILEHHRKEAAITQVNQEMLQFKI